MQLMECIPKVEEDVWNQMRAESCFPLEVFPTFLQNLVMELQNINRYPIDYTAGSMLMVLSTCIGNTMRVQVEPGYVEYFNEFMALVGNPGSCKSHPFDTMFKAVAQVDTEWSEEFNQKLDDYEASKDSQDKDTQKKMPPVGRQCLVGDVTQESLFQLLRENPRGLCVKIDELTGWVRNFDRYKAGKGSEESVWLSFFSHKDASKNRATDRHKYKVTDPFVSVVGTIQLGVLKNELLSGDKGNNGFFERILFALPLNLDKKHREKNKQEPMCLECWNSLTSALVQIPYDKDEVKTITLTDEADDRALEYCNHLTDLCNAQHNTLLKGVYSKMDIHFYRLMGLLHVSYWLCCEAELGIITLDLVEKAIQLTEYFRHSAERILGHIFMEDLSPDAHTLYDTLPMRFTYGEGLQLMSEMVGSKQIKMSESTYKRLLQENENTLFRRLHHGDYEKLL